MGALLLATLFMVACSRHDASIPIVTAVPNFSGYASNHEKKRAFVDFLTPIIVDENKKIAQDRLFLLGMKQKYQAQINFSSAQKKRLSQLATRYRVDTTIEDPLFWSTLLLRVDGIPPSLAVTQAAIESAWGTSRFALEGNNLFGHWCFNEGCGIVPNKRKEGKRHEVAKFESVNKAVEKYLLNLNQLNAYKQLRMIRAQLRTSEQPVTGQALTAGLENYSELGPHYINKVRKIIAYKIIQPLDQLSVPKQS
ncbi:MAG: glucosaminidase domain-containing protein [Marinagarivorans sp.]|nr:glucosaminidase domain-containing protein [Marinagarivorans sp.]